MMLTRRSFIKNGSKTAAAIASAGSALSAIAGCAHSVPSRIGLLGPSEGVAGSRSLQAHASRHGLIYGSAVSIHNVQDDAAFADLVREQCGIVVPTGELKWIPLRPSRDRFDFARPDFLLEFAQRNDMLMRGHTLCWHESVPDWIKMPENKPDTRQLFIDHITTVCKHFAGHMHSWDVVNEAILPSDGQPGGLRKSFWYEQMGPGYIELAFRTARAADPHAKLTYNDYGVEYENPNNAEHRRLVLDLVRDLKQRNVPIDAVGIQSHLNAAQPFTFGKGLADYIESIRQTGLEVYLTELDVNEDDISSDDPAQRDTIIAQTYADFLRIALANPAVRLVLNWDLSDRFTWLNNGPTHHRKRPNRPQRALPFDREYHPKEAFFAMRDSFDRRPTSA
jgi:endo-1,4-beta-xylanase